MDEDALHRLARRQRLGERDRALRVVLVGAGALEDLLEQAALDAAGDDVAVERVDEAVGLGVVAEAGLARLGRQAGAPGEQRRQLVADLLAHGAEAAGEHVAQVGLQDELVELDAVELQLLGEHAAHLPRRAGDEADARAAAGAQLAQAAPTRPGSTAWPRRPRTPSAPAACSVSNSVLR